jgi:copper oxidase (laccase) domain-containing protein
MAQVNINSQSYEVDEEVAEQFGKFIRKAKVSNSNNRELVIENNKLNNKLSEILFFIPSETRKHFLDKWTEEENLAEIAKMKKS